MAMIGMGAMGAMAWMWGRVDKDREAFYELVRDTKTSDPREVWDLCCSYHKKLKSELAEAQARIEAGEEIVRVGQGLAELRKMMEGPKPDGMLELKHAFGMEISEEEKSEALKKIQNGTVPIEVKKAIVAHWWTELMRLFVPWGIVLAEEIEFVEQHPCFRLVSADVREAVLRSEVVKYKDAYEGWKESCKAAQEREEKNFNEQMDKQEEWRKEKTRLLEKLAQYENMHAKAELDD